MTTICLNESSESTTGVGVVHSTGWFHRLRTTPSGGASSSSTSSSSNSTSLASSSTSSDDNETSSNSSLNSNEIKRSCMSKHLRFQVQRSVEDETIDESTQLSKARTDILDDDGPTDDVRSDIEHSSTSKSTSEFEDDDQTTTSSTSNTSPQVWCEIINPTKGEPQDLTSTTIRVKINRKSHHPLITQSNKLSKSNSESEFVDICTSSVPKSTTSTCNSPDCNDIYERTIIKSDQNSQSSSSQSTEIMAESIVLSQTSRSPSSHVVPSGGSVYSSFSSYNSSPSSCSSSSSSKHSILNRTTSNNNSSSSSMIINSNTTTSALTSSTISTCTTTTASSSLISSSSTPSPSTNTISNRSSTTFSTISPSPSSSRTQPHDNDNQQQQNILNINNKNNNSVTKTTGDISVHHNRHHHHRDDVEEDDDQHDQNTSLNIEHSSLVSKQSSPIVSNCSVIESSSTSPVTPKSKNTDDIEMVSSILNLTSPTSTSTSVNTTNHNQSNDLESRSNSGDNNNVDNDEIVEDEDDDDKTESSPLSDNQDEEGDNDDVEELDNFKQNLKDNNEDDEVKIEVDDDDDEKTMEDDDNEDEEDVEVDVVEKDHHLERSVPNETSMEDEDEMMNNDQDFDPTEVLKRMKVELKEEFDDDEEEEENNQNDQMMTSDRHKQLILSMLKQQQQQQQHHKNNQHHDNHKMHQSNLFVGNAASFDSSSTVDYFRKIFSNSAISNSSPTDELHNRNTNNHHHRNNQQQQYNDAQSAPHQSQNQSQLAAFTAAAAAAFAAAQNQQQQNGGSNNTSGSSSSTSDLLDESKKRLIQAILLKQLNGDFQNDSILESKNTSNNQNNNQSGPSTNAVTQPNDPQQRFCSSCNIQFISAKTFKVHKELYCSGRHNPTSIPPVSSSTSSSANSIVNPSIVSTISSNSNNQNQTNMTCHDNLPHQTSHLGRKVSHHHHHRNSHHNIHHNSSGHHHHQQQQHQLSHARHNLNHNMSPPPLSLASNSSSPNLSHSSGSLSTRKRSNSSSWTSPEGLKESDLAALFPNLVFPNHENLSNSSANNSSTEPIYIAISTNPLILLPFIFNPSTNSLVPMSNTSSINPNSTNFGSNFSNKSNAPIIFPNGMPQLSSNEHVANSLSSSSPSSSSHSTASNHSSTNQSSPRNQMPFITTFSNLSQHLLNNSTGQTAGLASSVSPQPSPQQQQQQQQQHHQTTSALINSLINSELNNSTESKSICKKRRQSTEDQQKQQQAEQETDQPLDLSSGSALPSKVPKRSKDDSIAAAAAAASSFAGLGALELQALAAKMAAKKEAQSDSALQDSLNNFMQKFAQLQSLQQQQQGGSAVDQLASSLLFPGLGGLNPTNNTQTGIADQLAAINVLARENPTFAQYLAFAMSAISGASGGPNSGQTGQGQASVPSTVPSVSPQVDVVVKQGNSRCVECNIVFYKHENYLVHKELYCASRRTSGSSADSNNHSPVPVVPSSGSQNGATPQTLTIARPTSAHSSASSAASPSLMSPGASKYSRTSDLRSPKVTDELRLSTSPSMMRESASVSPGAVSMASPRSTSSQSASATIFQYYCAACGIKFTSYDNLQAHQTYYCLKRSSSAAMNTQVPNPGASISPGQQNPHPSTSPTVLPPPLLTPQQILAAAAHLQGADLSGLDFTSPGSLSQHLALITAAAQAAVTGKNHLNHLAPPMIGDFNCSKCKATYVSAETLAAHVCSADLRPPDKIAQEEQQQQQQRTNKTGTGTTPTTSSLQTYKCTICGYKGHTMRGMRTHVRVHSEQLAASGAYEEEFIVQNTDLPEPSSGRGRGSHLHLSNRQRRRSSLVAADAQEQLLEQQRKALSKYNDNHADLVAKLNNAQMLANAQMTPEALAAQNHTCQFCRYTSNYKGNVIRHIKLVHKDIASAQLAATLALQQQAFAKELMLGGVGVGDGTSSSAGDHFNSSDIDPSEMVSIKCEESSKSPIRLNGTASPCPSKTDAEGSEDTSGPSTNSATNNNSNNNNNIHDSDLENKFCTSCNISFTYRNSYLAHKKYYCSSHTSEL